MKGILKRIILTAVIICVSAASVLFYGGCVRDIGGQSEPPISDSGDKEESELQPEDGNNDDEIFEESNVMKVNINGVIFTAEIAENATAKAFYSMLPLELEMLELNGNEKYCYLNESLPAEAENPRTINCGDIMLFGSSCVVVFYKTFSTSYSYTRLGRITNANELAEAVGNGSVQVIFSK